MSAAELGLLDKTMHKIFDPEGKLKDGNGIVKPFGGKVMVFLGDSAQLRPVCSATIYDKGLGPQSCSMNHAVSPTGLIWGVCANNNNNPLSINTYQRQVTTLLVEMILSCLVS